MSDSVETPSIKTSELGYSFSKDELQKQCKAIYGGVAWPGKNPGFVVVVGMGKEKHFDSHDICLLDEFESNDIRELVRKCGTFDFKYHPTIWVGDNRQDAADRFIREMNQDFETKETSTKETSWFKSPAPEKRPLCLTPTQILEMKQPYTYMLPELKRLLDKDRRQLFVKDSASLNYLTAFSPEEIPTLEISDFPAIEALAFAVIEMRDRENYSDANYDHENSKIAESYSTQGVFG